MRVLVLHDSRDGPHDPRGTLGPGLVSEGTRVQWAYGDLVRRGVAPPSTQVLVGSIQLRPNTFAVDSLRVIVSRRLFFRTSLLDGQTSSGFPR